MPGGTNVVLGELGEADADRLCQLLGFSPQRGRSKAIRFALHFTAANYRPGTPAPEPPPPADPSRDVADSSNG